MSVEYAKLNTIKEQQQVIITKKTKEATQHKRIKEEAQNATIVLNRRLVEIQKSIQNTPACGPTASQAVALENELKQVQSEITTNTKIAELESKSESKVMKEVDAANTMIFDQEKVVNKLVEEVSIINDKTEYAEAQKEVILEQQNEEKLENDVVNLEVEAFQANQSALAEEATLRELASYSQGLAMGYQQQLNEYNQKKSEINREHQLSNQTIMKVEKELSTATKPEDKERLMKNITTIRAEMARDLRNLADMEKKLEEKNLTVVEAEKVTKTQEIRFKEFQNKSMEMELKVSTAQDSIVQNCQKQVQGKKDAATAA